LKKIVSCNIFAIKRNIIFIDEIEEKLNLRLTRVSEKFKYKNTINRVRKLKNLKTQKLINSK